MDVRNPADKQLPINPNIFSYNNNNNNTTTTTAGTLESTILSLTQPTTLDLPLQHHIHTRDPEPTPSFSLSPTPSLSRSLNELEMIRYRECQKNHAAHLGSHVVDGCGEFMPSGDEGSPQALRCAACECHRNFHRREAEGEASTAATPPPPLLRLPTPHHTTPTAPTTHTPSANCFISFNRPQKIPPVVKPNSVHRHSNRAPVMMAFGGPGAAAESSSEDLNAYRTGEMGGQFVEQYGASKKRFRTKFTQEQKDKMMEFAEKIGWKIQRQDDGEVQQFCHENGLKRQVFKVWMHNNKQALKRKLS